jgi:hypothetical protein
MNSKKLREIIKDYKKNIGAISKKEIYKWRAVKCFQDNWDINATEFSTMLVKSFACTANLLGSGNYFPRRMLFECAESKPETVRQLFINLYNEEEDLKIRIPEFREGIRTIIKKDFPDKNDYQDERAIMVYLCLKYPERYYLYKISMFEEFVNRVDYPYLLKRGRENKIPNVLQYLSLCRIVRDEIAKNAELIELHKTRIDERKYYYDSSYHILTQDIIWSAVHSDINFSPNADQDSATKRLIEAKRTFLPKSDKVVLKGSFANHAENEKEKTRIGNLGESLVMQFEIECLKSYGINKAPEQISKTRGDGEGYDILSYDEEGNEKFIEVKTTSKGENTPFYITCNELEKSKLEKDRFFLYRLYEFDEINNRAKYFARKGDLTELCINPILFKAKASDYVEDTIEL